MLWLARRRLIGTLLGCACGAALGTAACSRESDRPWKGAAFPAFRLPTPAGDLRSSGDYAGQPLLVNFWATWCPPCRGEMAALDELHRQLGPRGLTVLAISVDSDVNLVREYLNRSPLGLTVLLDVGQSWSAAALQVPGFPTTYLIGRDNRIRDAWVGARAWDDASVQAQVAAGVELA